MKRSAMRDLTLFLLPGTVLFGAVLAEYALARVNDPDAYAWAMTMLDRRVGIVETAFLLVVCFAASSALRWNHLGHSRRACVPLAAVLICGAVILGVRTVALPSVLARAGLELQSPKPVPRPKKAAPVVVAAHVGDPREGKRIYLGTCAACHAPDGTGVKGQGQNIRDTDFLKDKSDENVLAFVKKGRQPFDPDSKLHLAMPARGGNPALTDANLLDSIAYLRELQRIAAETRAPAAIAAMPAVAASAAPESAPVSADQPQMIDGELWLPHSILAAAHAGPAGVALPSVFLQKPGARGHLPSNLRRFFLTLLTAFGLHSLYLTFGLVVGIVPLVKAVRRRDPREAIAMAAVYWVVLGSLGLVLVPAFFV